MIKRFLLYTVRFLLRVVYSFIKIFPTKNNIVFISRQSNEPSFDFICLSEQLKEDYSDYNIIFLCKKLGKKPFDYFKYSFHMLKQMYYLSVSKVAVLDSYCIVASVLKHKKSLKIIQIWHALGLMKKFAYSAIGNREGGGEDVARIMRLHRNYFKIICSSSQLKSEFAKAYDADKNTIIGLGLPRLDFLTSDIRMQQKKQQIFNVYPELDNGKRTIVYVPTFRKYTVNGYKKFVGAVDKKKFNLIVKFHGGKEYVYINGKRISRSSKYSGMEYLSVADFVVSDYSAIIFEAIAANKPLYLYCFDFDEYCKARGLFIDYQSIPAIISKSAKSIYTSILNNKQKTEGIKAFKNMYLPNTDINITKALTYLIGCTAKGINISEAELLTDERLKK